jgi:hypothetical protein
MNSSKHFSRIGVVLLAIGLAAQAQGMNFLPYGGMLMTGAGVAGKAAVKAAGKLDLAKGLVVAIAPTAGTLGFLGGIGSYFQSKAAKVAAEEAAKIAAEEAAKNSGFFKSAYNLVADNVVTNAIVSGVKATGSAIANHPYIATGIAIATIGTGAAAYYMKGKKSEPKKPVVKKPVKKVNGQPVPAQQPVPKPGFFQERTNKAFLAQVEAFANNAPNAPTKEALEAQATALAKAGYDVTKQLQAIVKAKRDVNSPISDTSTLAKNRIKTALTEASALLGLVADNK